MDQSSGRITALGRYLEGLAFPEEGSDVDSLSDTDESSDEYLSLE